MRTFYFKNSIAIIPKRNKKELMNADRGGTEEFLTRETTGSFKNRRLWSVELIKHPMWSLVCRSSDEEKTTARKKGGDV